MPIKNLFLATEESDLVGITSRIKFIPAPAGFFAGPTGPAGTATAATAAEYRANTPNLVIDTDGVWDAAGEVAITYASTIALNMSLFLNGRVTMTGNATLGAPTNAKPGQSGYIVIAQDATGNRTLAYNSVFKFSQLLTPVLSTIALKEDILFYSVLTSTRIYAALVKDVPL